MSLIKKSGQLSKLPVHKYSTTKNGDLLNFLVDKAQIHTEFELPFQCSSFKQENMGSGEPNPYDRPYVGIKWWFIKVTIINVSSL